MHLVDPTAGKVHQRHQVMPLAEHLGLESADTAR